MTKAIAYFRVSTDRQGASGLGLEAQESTVLAWMPNGMALFNAYTEVESGRKSDRSQLHAALKECRLHGAVLVVAKLDRLSRSQSFLMSLVDSGVEVAFCDLPNQDGPIGRFMLQSMAAVAELEAGMISVRTKAALQAARKRGVVFKGRPGAVVTAAMLERSAEARRASARQRAEDYRDVFEAIDGSFNAMSRELNRREIPTPSRRGSWTATAVKRVHERLTLPMAREVMFA